MWFRRLAGWKETRNTQNATRIKAGELLFWTKRLNTIRIYWLTNTTKQRYTILIQPETSFGVLPHHQSGVGIESPVCRNISLNMFPPVILRWLVRSGAIVFQSYHSSEKSNSQASPLHQSFVLQPPVAPQPVYPAGFLKFSHWLWSMYFQN